MQNLLNFTGFDWDDGNSLKNQLKHNVSKSEVEDVFFKLPLLILDDLMHSQDEQRFHALGRSDNNRLLQVAFTFRKSEIRVISTRDMNKKERKTYETYSSL